MARSATLSGTINWSDGTPFNGWALLLLIPPDGYSQMFLADIWPRVRLPLRLAVPVTNGAFNQNCKVWYNADLEPPNSKWVIYWLDYTGTTIASPASMDDAFTVSTETHNVETNLLATPSTEVSLPPVDWDPTPVALANFFTGDVNGGGYELTNLGRLQSNGSISLTGYSPGVNLGALGFIDYYDGNTIRMISRGANSAAYGALALISTTSDSSGVRNIITADTSGNLSFPSLPTFANNAAAASGGVPVGGLYIASSGDPRPICVRV